MAIEENGGMGTTMLMQPAGNTGMGFGNDGGWWILLLFILLAGNNGWGNSFGGNGYGAYDAGVQRGFDQSSIMGGINAINTGMTAGFANAETAANARQMSTIQQMFDMQSQFAQCCCENRLASCQTQNIIQNESNATRFADANNTRDILANQSANTQRILDQLCQDKIDAKNEKIADLERQLTMANLAASQTAQTSRILADNAAQTVALEQYLNPVPVPAYMVQNPNCCAQGYGCGCGA